MPFRVALVLALLPCPGLCQTLWEAGGARVETVSYACSSAIDDLSVAYFTAPDATSFAAMQIAGVVHALVQETSGSGLRFVDTDRQSGYRLHGKGDGVLLLKQEPGAGEQLLADCTARKG